MSDLEHCASSSLGVKCSDNFYEYILKDCDQVPGATYQNYGCQWITSESQEYFECSNRMDKIDVLFTIPPGATRLKPEAINYNRELIHYDQHQVSCGFRNISYKELEKLENENSKEECLLNSGKLVYVTRLFEDLLFDYSFELSSTFDELL